MVLVLIEWLKGLLSTSWNQRNTKEKQIVMGIASTKFRQPIEIKNGKKCGNGLEDYSICVPVNKPKKQINQIRSF